MKNLLIHIGSLNAGGAEKSLVSFLNTLPSDMFNVDLMLMREGGLFRNMIPDYVNIVQPPFPYNCLGISPVNWKFYIKNNIKYFVRKIYSLLKLKNNQKVPVGQILWPIWKNDVKQLDKEYDVAISYIEGIPNYYIIDKVKATKKILWIHNEYTKLGYNNVFDRTYFEKADAIVTVSEMCRNDLIRNFPEFKNKIHILENITNPYLIRKMADERIVDPIFENKDNTLKILSIGRLYPQKNYRLSIDAAKIIKDRGVNFKWYIIGDGILKEDLKKQIEQHSLNDYIILLGLRSNPYPYIKACDIIVQSSLYEGKSIAIDEAKILYKPIVATNYKTVYDIIKNRENGLIVEMLPEMLADKIIELKNDVGLRNRLIENLKKENVNNINEINKYINLINLE